MDKKAKNQSKSKGLILLFAAFVLIYSFLVISHYGYREIVNSPDEKANLFFIQNLIGERHLEVAEPLNQKYGDLLRPRSVNLYFGNYVPGSFLGMILVYGLFGMIFGGQAVYFLTAIISVIAAFYFYLFIRKIFNRKIGYLSSILLLFQPIFWYYSTRSFFHNTLFVCLLIIFFYYLSCCGGRKKSNYFLAGVFLVLAVWTRTSEAVWLAGTVILLFLIFKEKLYWRSLIIFLLVISVGGILILHLNNSLYGSIVNFGYSSLDQAGISAGSNFDYFLPFGFSWQNIMENFDIYFNRLVWWLFWPALLGMFFSYYKFFKLNKTRRAYLVLTTLAALFLIIYYGSWQPDSMQKTIGGAHCRYWLPIYVFTLPYVASFWLSLASYFKSQRFRYFITGGFLSLSLVLSGYLVFFSSADGLAAVSENLAEYDKIKYELLEQTDEEAIIITSWADKIIFPERKVITDFPVQDKMPALKKLAENFPVYYFELNNPEKAKELNSQFLAPAGLGLVKVAFTADMNYALYKLINTSHE